MNSPMPSASTATQTDSSGATTTDETHPAASGHTLSRRTLAKGAAWSVPVIAASVPAPAYAASPNSCVNRTIAFPSSFTNGGVIPVSVSNNPTVYVKVTTSATNLQHESRGYYSTSDYNLTYGTKAYGSAGRYPEYDINAINGRALVLNQDTPSSEQSVTFSFFSDAAARTPVDIYNLAVPIDDLSTGVTIKRGVFSEWDVPELSYQDVVQLTGRSASGAAATPSATSLRSSRAYGYATLSDLRGDPTTGWYIDANLVRWGRVAMGGTLNTNFGASTGVHSFTLRYTSNRQSRTSDWTGAQGLGIGQFSFCG